MNKMFLVVSVMAGLMLISCVGFVVYNNTQEVEYTMEDVYQGAVPQGYDLEHFRKTGETIKEEITNG